MSNTNPNKNIFTIFMIYLAVCLIFIVVVRNYSGEQLQRELVKVQTHISGMVNIRSTAISNWVEDKRAAVNSISENLTVKMYLATTASKNVSRDDVLTQEQFTTAYLNSVAENSGFKNYLSEKIKANVVVNSSAAIMLVNENGDPVLSIGYADNLKAIAGDLQGLANTQDVTFINSPDDKSTYLRVVKPIKKIQAENVIGYVIAVTKLDKEFFALLTFPPAEYKSSLSQLAFKNGTVVESISEDAANKKLITVENNQDMAEIYAVNNPDIIAEKNNSSGDKVFVSAKDLKLGYIFLIHTLSYKESFSEALRNASNLRRISYLVSLLLGAIIAFVWKHSTSEKYKKLHAEVQEKQRLLQLISENQIQAMFLVDDANRVAFANKVFIKKNKIKSEDEYKDKDIAAVVGSAAADDYVNLSIRAHDIGMPVTSLRKVKIKDRERFLQEKVIPIDSEDTDNQFTGSLFIENDITDLMNERYKYEQNLSNSIEILVRIIENRSKYFHNHGSQVHELSIQVADSLNVAENYRKAIDIASRISNLSLALLPRELINKQGNLTDKEKEIFNTIPQQTLQIIKDFNFDSPVIETLEQVSERVDGKGPKALSGDNIIVSARIIKVANDYVAMISPRPHRDKLTSEQAIENLLKDKDTKYSKDVVFALANVVMKK